MNKAIFLDRDNTIIDDPGYINDPGQVKLLPGAVETLSQLRSMGYMLVIISNQSGVARGIVTEEVLGLIHQRLKELLGKENVFLDGIYYCPFHPDGVVPEYTKQSDCRKPAPGMILRAASQLGIELNQSWMVGDSYRDVAAGKSSGCKTILINCPARPAIKSAGDPEPDRQAVNIKEAGNIIAMYDRMEKPAANIKIIQVEPEPQEEIIAPKPVIEEKPSIEKQVEEKKTVQEKPAKKAETKKQTTSAEGIGNDHSHHLLSEILSHLKKSSRQELYNEFATLKLCAVILQVLVLVPLFWSFCYLLNAERTMEDVQTAIGYAVVIELMAIWFIMLDSKK